MLKETLDQKPIKPEVFNLPGWECVLANQEEQIALWYKKKTKGFAMCSFDGKNVYDNWGKYRCIRHEGLGGFLAGYSGDGHFYLAKIINKSEKTY